MCLIKTIKLNELERYCITNILKEDKVVIKILYKELINSFLLKNINTIVLMKVIYILKVN